MYGKQNKTRTLLFRYGHYRRKGKIYRRSLRDCPLLASGIFLKTEIKSPQPKMPGTRAVLSCGLGLSPQPGWGGSGRSANQNMPGRRGSWAAWLAPQDAASENSNRIPEKHETQSECQCHAHPLAALTQVPTEAEENVEMISFR